MMDLTKDLPGVDVKLYRPRDGDILVIHSDQQVTQEAYRVTMEWFSKVLPGAHVLVMQAGTRLEVVRQV